MIEFLNRVFTLLERCSARIVGRVLVKGIGVGYNSRATYSCRTQSICQHFQMWLAVKRQRGLVIADSRWKHQNVNIAHSIFTRQYSAGGNDYPNLLEVPVFGHSMNHAGLQIADLICSGIVFPIACHVYCTGHIHTPHVNPRYTELRAAFSRRLRRLQYRYEYAPHRWTGGLSTSDKLGHRSPSLLLRDP